MPHNFFQQILDGYDAHNAVVFFHRNQVGAAVGLSQTQFGLWAAVAIHDTSSVVGATLKYGPGALAIGTTVKLVRALWIVPVTVGIAAWFRHRGKKTWPWFIVLFVVAAWVHSHWPEINGLSSSIVIVARTGFSVTLFLIGAGLSRSAVKRVGWRPFAQGLLLWILITASTLLVIRSGRVGL